MKAEVENISPHELALSRREALTRLKRHTMNHDKRRVSSLVGCSRYTRVCVGKDAGSFPFVMRHNYAGVGYARN